MDRCALAPWTVHDLRGGMPEYITAPQRIDKDLIKSCIEIQNIPPPPNSPKDSAVEKEGGWQGA